MKWIDAPHQPNLGRPLWISHVLMLLPMALFGVATICLWHQKYLHPYQTGLLLVVLLVICFSVGLYMAKRLTRKSVCPLNQLASALKACAQGDFSTRLAPDLRHDTMLPLYFNQFMDQMAAYSDKLKVEIHERQLTEQALTESQALFDVFMAHLPALAMVKDAHGRYLYVNDACHTLLNMAPEAMVNATDDDLWPADTAEQIRHHDNQVMHHNQVLNAVEKVPVGDAVRHHLVTKFPILKNGQPHMLAAIAFDITDKVQAEQDKIQLEQQLIQGQKMEAIGTLAGGIAHDFNNMLAAILGYVELAQLDAAQGRNVNFELDQVLKAAHRAKDLVSQILTFSRKTEQDRQPLDPKPLIKEALKLLRASLPTTIEIRSQLDSDQALIMANTTQLHQVIMNLCTNAAHAMEAHGGMLAVGLDRSDLANSAAASKGVAPGRYMELTIRDTGHGIPPALQERIFDPYFTTKAKGKGTGMGLAVVHGIVKSHGGAIVVESEPGQGACFKILLPVTCEEAEEASHPKEALPMGDESILFVDDEPFLVDLVKQMLARLGYRVTSCVSSVEAYEKVRQDPTAYDLVITDMTMPHMTGDELAGRISALRSDLPVILCTGYSEQVAVEKASQLGLAAIIMKPVTINALASAVRKALDLHNSAIPSSATSPRLKVVSKQ